MNAKEYIDEIILRASRLDVNLELDSPTILTFLNRARRDVQKGTMSLFPERYGKITEIAITSGMAQSSGVVKDINGRAYTIFEVPCPNDFIDPWVVILRYKVNGTVPGASVAWTNAIFNSECRRVSQREIYGVQTQQWNKPTIQNPVYSVESKNVDQMTTNTHNYPYLYICGLDMDKDKTIFHADYSSIITDVKLELWYVAALPDIEDTPTDLIGSVPDDEITIPPDFDELVIYNTLMYCLQKVNAGAAYDLVSAERQSINQILEQAYADTKNKMSSLLPSKESIGA